MPVGNSPHSHCQPQATTDQLSVSMVLSSLEFSYNWNYIESLCVTSFTYSIFEVHPYLSVVIPFVLLNSIQVSICYMLFMHSLVDRHLLFSGV